MHDSLQQGVQALALQSGPTRAIAIVCAALVVYVMAALRLVTLVWQRTRVTRAGMARVVLLVILAYLVGKSLSGLISDPRPDVVAHTRPLFPLARDNGFPSDHTLLAAALTASLWWIDRRWVPACALGTVLVLLGRLAVGAHHTLDVAGSVAIVAAVALAVGAVPLPAPWGRPLLVRSAPRTSSAPKG